VPKSESLQLFDSQPQQLRPSDSVRLTRPTAPSNTFGFCGPFCRRLLPLNWQKHLFLPCRGLAGFLALRGLAQMADRKHFRDRPALQKPLSISKLGETINAILATAGDKPSPKIQ
jgi:hypothetical protein